MRRRDLLSRMFGIAALGGIGLARASHGQHATGTGRCMGQISSPERGTIRAAFLISDEATVIDFCGPWEVFQDVMLHEGGMRHPFKLYTVAESRKPVRVTGGMQIVADYTLEDAPQPDILVVPA